MQSNKNLDFTEFNAVLTDFFPLVLSLGGAHKSLRFVIQTQTLPCVNAETASPEPPTAF